MKHVLTRGASGTGRLRRKIFAIASAGAVIGVGTAATLASWNDNEWVGGSAGTSSFEVAQNREQAPTNASTWTDHPTDTTAGALTFDIDALSLTPGDSAYAPVAIQTKQDSIAGELTLQAPEDLAAVPATELWDAMQYSVKVTDTATACTEATWATFGTSVVTDSALSASIAPAAQTIDADRANIQYYCFRVTLPATPDGVADVNALQGLAVEPAWRFAAVSTQ